MNDVDELIELSKLKILGNPSAIFIRSVLFKLNWEIVKEEDFQKYPTACTDGKTIKLNPNFLKHINNPDKIAGLFLHEAWHIALDHTNPARNANKNQEVWNVAGDYVINLLIKDSGFVLPDGGLIDQKFRDWSTDEVYNHIMENQEDFKKALSQPDVQSHVEQTENTTEGETIQQEINQMVVSAAIEQTVEGYGNESLPKELKERIYNLQNPQVNWKTALRKYVNAIKRNDYSTKKFNKKYLPGFYIPSLYSEDVGTIAMALDISGSITEKDANNFISEVRSILKIIKPDEIVVYLFNTKIVKIIKVNSLKDVDKISVNSNGGTNVNPVLEHIINNKINPKVFLIFSDMWIPEVKAKIPFPTIWVAFDNPKFKSNQGVTIHYDSSRK